MTTSKVLSFALLTHLFVAATGCGVFGSDDSAPGEEQPAAPGETPKAPQVGGPADTSELTNTLGIFVATTGNNAADGTREHPVASVQTAIELATKVGKRVYACAGTFKEALVVADSISVIGGLDCTGNEWRTSDKRTRIEAPTSPALRATNIVSPTRLEGLDVVAPSATEPSASSIGLIADHAGALVIARTKITAGDGANGVDGTEGVQLETSLSANGANFVAAHTCDTASCTSIFIGGLRNWLSLAGSPGGINECGGGAHAAQSGGAGGGGGLWSATRPNGVAYVWSPYKNAATSNASSGDKSRTSAAGVAGGHGANAAPIGSVSREGYTAASGAAGKDGAPGSGGAGGDGKAPITLDPATIPAVDTWRGFGGASGGAGGCPGLAGTAGTGGGASIAALLLDSAIVIDTSELVSGRGGKGGNGTFGSAPTAGGHAGGGAPTIIPFATAYDGGPGGASGVSGNGSSGPSAGVVHVGVSPKVADTTKITPGTGGAAISARSNTDASGTKTIPATPAGMTAPILAR